MKNLKKIRNEDIYKAFKKYSSEIDFKGDYKEAIKYFRDNQFEIYELARNSDSFGKISSFSVNVKEDDFREYQEIYEEWVNKHNDICSWLDFDTILQEDTNDGAIERIIFNEITGN